MIEHDDTLIEVSGDDERCSLDELFNRFACSLVVTGIEAENE